MKWISYFLTWISIIFGISAAFCVILTGHLTFYYSNHLPELTGKLLLLIWLFILLFTCLALYLFVGSIGKEQNLGGKRFPLWVPVVNQLVGVVVYIVVAKATGFIDYFYFTSVFLKFAMKELWHGAIITSNQDIWMLGLTIGHAAIYASVSLIAYMRERYLQLRKYEIGMSHRNEK